MFLSFPDFEGRPIFSDFDRPSHNCSMVSFHVLVISGLVEIFPTLFGFGPPAFPFTSCPDFCGFLSDVLRCGPAVSQLLFSCKFLLFTDVFRIFPLRPSNLIIVPFDDQFIFEPLRPFPLRPSRQTLDPCHVPFTSAVSALAKTSHNCCLRCSCHCRIFRIVSTCSDSCHLSHNCSLSCSCQTFRTFPVWTTRIFAFSDLDRPSHNCPLSWFPFMFVSFLGFPGFSDFFQFGPPVSQLLLFAFLSFPDFSDFFRMCPAVTILTRPLVV